MNTGYETQCEAILSPFQTRTRAAVKLWCYIGYSSFLMDGRWTCLDDEVTVLHHLITTAIDGTTILAPGHEGPRRRVGAAGQQHHCALCLSQIFWWCLIDVWRLPKHINKSVDKIIAEGVGRVTLDHCMSSTVRLLRIIVWDKNPNICFFLFFNGTFRRVTFITYVPTNKFPYAIKVEWGIKSIDSPPYLWSGIRFGLTSEYHTSILGYHRINRKNGKFWSGYK